MKRIDACTAILGIVLCLVCQNATAFNALSFYEFQTDGNANGWTPTNATATVSGGMISGTATTGDPQLANDVTNFPGYSSSGLLVRYRGGKNGNVELFWGRSGADSYNAARSVTASYTGGGAWQTLFLCPRGNAEWDGQTITRLRLDPTGTAADDTFDIDWIRLLAWDYDNDGVRDEIEGAGDSDGDGLMNLEDLDSNNDGLTDAWENAIANAPGSVRFDFNTDGNAEGWAPNANLTLQGVSGGLATSQITGTDPQFTRGRLHLQGDLIDALIIRFQSPVSGSFTLFWAHDAVTSFNGTRSMTVTVPASASVPRSVYFDLRNAPEWNGKLITSLRLDPNFSLNTVFSIDSIRTSDGDYDRDGLSDSSEGAADTDGDGLPNYQDPDSDGDGVSDAEETRRGWNPLSVIEASRDSDGDGVSDASESKAGTDPQSANDRPRLGIQHNGSGFDLSIDTRSGRSYALRASNNLIAWTPDGTVPQTTNPSMLTWSVPVAGASNRFYRVNINGAMEPPAPADASNPTSGVGSSESPFLDNGVLRLGTPTNEGASINFLSANGGGNLINMADQGRLIQQSYYAGANLDRTADGQSASWSPWSWNPIQGGDASNKISPVMEVSVGDFGDVLYTRTVPLLWDMTNGEKAQAWMDQWNQFEPGMPDTIRVTCRLTCFRDSTDIWGGAVSRHQELPAVYLIRSLSKAVSYQGANPWTNDVTEEVPTPGPPWGDCFPTEGWVAMVNPATNIGVGLYSPIGTTQWNVGATGSPPGSPTSSATMHMAPLRTMRLDRDSILVYRYWIIYGDLATIRSRVYELRNR